MRSSGRYRCMYKAQSRINPEGASQSAVLQRIHINKGSRIWQHKAPATLATLPLSAQYVEGDAHGNDNGQPHHVPRQLSAFRVPLRRPATPEASEAANTGTPAAEPPAVAGPPPPAEATTTVTEAGTAAAGPATATTSTAKGRHSRSRSNNAKRSTSQEEACKHEPCRNNLSSPCAHGPCNQGPCN